MPTTALVSWHYLYENWIRSLSYDARSIFSDQTPAQHRRRLESRSFSVQRCLLNGCSLSFVLMVLLLLLYALLYTELAGKIASTHVDSTSTTLYYSEVHGPNSAFVMHTHTHMEKTTKHTLYRGERMKNVMQKCFYKLQQDKERMICLI